MNEELRKLMVEAGFAAPELAGRAKKLAELIILRCADLADKNSPLSYPDHGIKIKRHFGLD